MNIWARVCAYEPFGIYAGNDAHDVVGGWDGVDAALHTVADTLVEVNVTTADATPGMATRVMATRVYVSDGPVRFFAPTGETPKLRMEVLGRDARVVMQRLVELAK